jgi:hypothetical protein
MKKCDHGISSARNRNSRMSRHTRDRTARSRGVPCHMRDTPLRPPSDPPPMWAPKLGFFQDWGSSRIGRERPPAELEGQARRRTVPNP